MNHGVSPLFCIVGVGMGHCEKDTVTLRVVWSERVWTAAGRFVRTCAPSAGRSHPSGKAQLPRDHHGLRKPIEPCGEAAQRENGAQQTSGVPVLCAKDSVRRG